MFYTDFWKGADVLIVTNQYGGFDSDDDDEENEPPISPAGSSEKDESANKQRKLVTTGHVNAKRISFSGPIVIL